MSLLNIPTIADVRADFDKALNMVRAEAKAAIALAHGDAAQAHAVAAAAEQRAADAHAQIAGLKAAVATGLRDAAKIGTEGEARMSKLTQAAVVAAAGIQKDAQTVFDAVKAFIAEKNSAVSSVSSAALVAAQSDLAASDTDAKTLTDSLSSVHDLHVQILSAIGLDPAAVLTAAPAVAAVAAITPETTTEKAPDAPVVTTGTLSIVDGEVAGSSLFNFTGLVGTLTKGAKLTSAVAGLLDLDTVVSDFDADAKTVTLSKATLADMPASTVLAFSAA